MAKNKICVLSVLACIFFCACVKDPQDIPGSMINNPSFTIGATFGNTPVDLEAGIDGWTIQPTTENVSGGIIYSSLFSKDGCLVECNPSIEFRFHMDDANPGTLEENFLHTIQQGQKEYIKSDAERDSFEISVSTHPGLFMSGISSWENINSTETTFQAEFATNVAYNDNLNVCFQSLAFTGCQYMQCLYFDPATLVPCIAFILPKVESDRQVSLTVVPEGTGPFAIEWFNGSTDPSIVLQVQDTVVEIYAGVTVTDANGNRAEISQIVRVQFGIVDPCYFPIDLVSNLVEHSDDVFVPDAVEIIYREENGEVWKSTGGLQLLPSFMQITNVEFFGESPMQQPAYQTTISFSVLLFNENTGESRVFAANDAVIALSHP